MLITSENTAIHPVARDVCRTRRCSVDSVHRASLCHILWRVQVCKVICIVAHLDHKLLIRDGAGSDVVCAYFDCIQYPCCLTSVSIALHPRTDGQAMSRILYEYTLNIKLYLIPCDRIWHIK